MYTKIKKLTANVKLGVGIAIITVAGITVLGAYLINGGSATAAVPANFVYRSGTKLMLNGSQYKFVGYNAFGMFGCEGSAWSRAQMDTYFAGLPAASMTRVWAFRNYGTGMIDQAVASAAAHNQKLILTLTNDLNDCVSDGAKNNTWYTSGYKSSYLGWAKQAAAKYKDSPAVGMYEIANEPGQAQGEGSLNGTTMKNFFQDVAASIKAADPNHLVGTGDNYEANYSGGKAAYQTASSAVAIDVLSLHDYESDYVSNGPVISTHFSPTKSAADALGKPIIIGEINDNSCKTAKSTRAANVKNSIDSYLSNGASGVLVWNFSQSYYNFCSSGGEDYIVTPADPLHTIIKNYSIKGNVVTPPAGGGTPAPVPTPNGCTATSNYGSTTQSITVPATGTYKIWGRIMAPDTTNNSYWLDVDSKSCAVMGDSTAIPAKAWAWIGYKDGNAGSPVTMNLTAGAHTFKIIGREAGVKVDRLLALSDQACIPTGVGNNCTASADATAPTVAITSPTNGASVKGTVTISAAATDNIAVSKAEFYIDNTLKSTATAAPFKYTWNSGDAANGAHTISVKAYDAAGNIGATTSSVTVSNGDSQAPSVPAGVTAKANGTNKVTVTWAPSTDNLAVTGYSVTRNGALLALVTSGATYTDNTVVPNTQYSYQVSAYDAAGNKSAVSAAASVKTPQPTAADTQAPTVPAGVLATPVSPSQVNLTWAAATDNVSVVGYDVYRSLLNAPATKVATVTGVSFGDSGLQSDSLYTYYVVARDAAGNVSAHSANAAASTPKVAVQAGTLRGVVAAGRGRLLKGVTVTLWSSDGKQYTTTTNSSGVYRFDSLSQAYYAATYHLNGYRDQQVYFEVKAGQNIVKNIKLTNSASRPWWRSWWR